MGTGTGLTCPQAAALSLVRWQVLHGTHLPCCVLLLIRSQIDWAKESESQGVGGERASVRKEMDSELLGQRGGLASL